MNNRGLATNSFLANQILQQDTISQSDSGIEQSNSPLTTLKQRAIMNYRSSNDRFSTNPSVLHSNSSNSITNSSINPTNYEYLKNSSSMKQIRSLFEGIPDLSNENNDSIPDDQVQYDRNSSTDDRQSISSPEKTRKHIISTKLFKPFQNIRFRKKNSTS